MRWASRSWPKGWRCRRRRPWLQTMGCDAAQGYFFARPMARADLLQLLDDQDRQAATQPAGARRRPDEGPWLGLHATGRAGDCLKSSDADRHAPETALRTRPLFADPRRDLAAASFLPCRGQAAAAFGWLANAVIVLLFFLHGAKLSREAIWAGVGHWRLHLLVAASTFVLFPALGLAVRALGRGWIDPGMTAGVLFLCLLPSTVQSSIAFTSIARGNTPAAVCSATLSNVVGIFLDAGAGGPVHGRPGQGRRRLAALDRGHRPAASPCPSSPATCRDRSPSSC